MTSFSGLSGFSDISSSTTQSSSDRVMQSAVEKAGSSNPTITGAATTSSLETDSQSQKDIMSSMGIGSGLDVSV
jgi:hypothetical protein